MDIVASRDGYCGIVFLLVVCCSKGSHGEDRQTGWGGMGFGNRAEVGERNSQEGGTERKVKRVGEWVALKVAMGGRKHSCHLSSREQARRVFSASDSTRAFRSVLRRQYWPHAFLPPELAGVSSQGFFRPATAPGRFAWCSAASWNLGVSREYN